MSEAIQKILDSAVEADSNKVQDIQNWRSRKMIAVLYPEDEVHSLAMENIKSGGYQYLAVLHDKDVDEAGELKKPHWHVYLKFKNARYVQGVADELGITPNYLRKANDEKNCVGYLIHWNTPEKYQYEASECFGTLTPILDKILLQDEDEGFRITRFLDALDDIYGPISFSSAVRLSCSLGLYSDVRRGGALLANCIKEHNEQFVRKEDI